MLKKVWTLYNYVIALSKTAAWLDSMQVFKFPTGLVVLFYKIRRETFDRITDKFVHVQVV